jgi:hypothetical protein
MRMCCRHPQLHTSSMKSCPEALSDRTPYASAQKSCCAIVLELFEADWHCARRRSAGSLRRCVMSRKGITTSGRPNADTRQLHVNCSKLEAHWRLLLGVLWCRRMSLRGAFQGSDGAGLFQLRLDSVISGLGLDLHHLGSIFSELVYGETGDSRSRQHLEHSPPIARSSPIA